MNHIRLFAVVLISVLVVLFGVDLANTTTNTILNNGNVGRGLKDTFSKDGTKSILAAAATAGVTGGLSSELGVGMDAKTLKPVNTTDLGNRAKYAAMNTVIKTAADTAILDKPAGEAFVDNLRNNVGTQLQAAGASHLGHAYQNENIPYLGHKGGHFVLGMAAGALTDKPIEGAVEGIQDLVSREKGVGGFLDF